MSEIEDEHRDLAGSTSNATPPPTMKKPLPGRTMVAVLLMLAVLIAIAVLALIPNGGTTP